MTLHGQLLYCDDPKLYGPPYLAAMDGRVGLGLRLGDCGIKQDLFHGAERFDRVLLPGHSLGTQVRGRAGIEDLVA